MVHLPSFSLGNVFGKAKGLVVSILVATFSLSSMTFQMAQMLYEHAGIARRTVFLIHVGLELLNLLVSLLLWPSQALQMGDVLQFSRGHLQRAVHGAVTAKGSGSLSNAWSAVRSKSFVFFVTSHTLHMWFNRCLMGWIDAELTWKSDQLIGIGAAPLDKSTHLTVFNVTHCSLGLLAVPVFGWLVAKFGHKVAPFVATNILAVLYLSLLLVPAEWPLYSIYVVSAWHRQFFFSTFFNFLISEFPVELFGTLGGFAGLVSGLASYTQNPILDFVLGSLRGDFTAIILVQLGLAALLLPCSLSLIVVHSAAHTDAAQNAAAKCDDDRARAEESTDNKIGPVVISVVPESTESTNHASSDLHGICEGDDPRIPST